MQYSIGQLSNLLGLNIQTIRYYERISLLPAVNRGENGYRIYTDLHKDFLEYVIFAKHHGFSLKQISRYCMHTKDGTYNPEYLFEVMDQKIEEFEDEVSKIKKKIKLLKKKKGEMKKKTAADSECPIETMVQTMKNGET